MSALIVGVDPGFTGGIAFLSEGGLRIHDMPVYKSPQGRTELNLMETAKTLIPPAGHSRYIAVLEKVSARPGQGTASLFRFGQGYGALEMALTAHGYELHYKTPTTWKKYFGLSSDKGVSRSLATQRFPASASMFTRVKDDGRAEAALLALYGREQILRTAA